MQFADARALLESCTRNELRDHAFGDTEISWMKDGREVAGGYFSGRNADVWIRVDEDSTIVGFEDMEARQLRDYGIPGQIFRNDETGPKEFQEGQVMPRLTIDGVLQEITTPRDDSRL